MKHVCAILVALGIVTGAQADLLLAWEVSGVNAVANPFFTNTTAAANMDTPLSVMTLGAGVTPSATANTFGGSSFNEISLTDAITANDYISWVVKASDGYQVSVTNIAMNFQRSTTGGSNMVLRSSLDGFTADLRTWTDFAGTAGGGDASFALALSPANQIEFRLYAWSASDSGGLDRFRTLAGNDLAITGTIAAVPEPASALLLGLGAGLLAWNRRRKNLR